MTRKLILSAVGCLALAVTAPALAQGNSGGHGGGPGGGMGAGPPISPPGQAGGGMGTSDLGRGLGSQHGQFGRDFANQQHLTSEQRQQLALEYQQAAQARRANATQLAVLARQGASFPADASTKIRGALKEDIDAWRDQFQVDRKAWQAMRDQWLVDRGSLTPQEWAIRRSAWFDARDAWIANQKAWAMARRH
jgi:hypothetical protein